MNNPSSFIQTKDSFKQTNIFSFCYVEGKWEQISISDIERYKKINPQDWQLAKLNEIKHKYYCAIQTIARQEERYLKEWIEYHLNLGTWFWFNLWLLGKAVFWRICVSYVWLFCLWL